MLIHKTNRLLPNFYPLQIIYTTPENRNRQAHKIATIDMKIEPSISFTPPHAQNALFLKYIRNTKQTKDDVYPTLNILKSLTHVENRCFCRHTKKMLRCIFIVFSGFPSPQNKREMKVLKPSNVKWVWYYYKRKTVVMYVLLMLMH